MTVYAPHRLSPREREIAVLVAQGHPTKAIAAILGISAWTVMTHLRRVYARFGVQSRAAMVVTLLARGLLEIPRVSDTMTSWMPSAPSSGISRKSRT